MKLNAIYIISEVFIIIDVNEYFLSICMEFYYYNFVVLNNFRWLIN
jgi:hypothetical protein